MLADGIEKATAIGKIIDDSGYDILIETGTSYGETISHIAGKWDIDTITIENDYDKYLNALETLHNLPVQQVYADSAKYLPRLLNFINRQSIVFLDAHDIDVEKPTPILDELKCILHYSYVGRLTGYMLPGHWIIIDDARLFGTGVWPLLESVQGMMTLDGLYEMDVQNDLIYLRPL